MNLELDNTRLYVSSFMALVFNGAKGKNVVVDVVNVVVSWVSGKSVVTGGVVLNVIASVVLTVVRAVSVVSSS